jgi:sec-independent protein translocase protein TatA
VFSGLESPFHWLVLAIVALIVFGPKRLPELGRSLGSGLRGFREALSGLGEGEPDETAATRPDAAPPDEPE